MVFNLALGVQNVPSDAAATPAYARLIADTVQATAGQVGLGLYTGVRRGARRR